jgi:hypothetical protein
VIRPFGLYDILTVRQLQKGSVPLDLRRQVLYRDAPARAALLGFLTQYRFGPLTWMYAGRDAGRDGRAFAQVWPIADRPDWNLSRLAPSLEDGEGAEALWREMLRGLVRRAADSGVFRIFTRVEEGSDAERVLRRNGFVATTRQELFVLPAAPGPVSSPKHLVPAEPRHDWALGELYRQVVPRFVQEAEASFCHACASPRRHTLGGEAVREYVWQDAERVNAYFAVSTASLGSWVEILVRPEHRGDIMPHIRHVIGNVAARERPIYCPVPDYDVGVGWLLRTLGFQPVGRQAHMVMHVAARVPVRRPLLVTGLEGSVDIRTPIGTAHGVCGHEHCA